MMLFSCPRRRTKRCDYHVEACGDDAEVGYASGYEPDVTTSLAAPYETELITGKDNDVINTTITVDCELFAGACVAASSLGDRDIAYRE